MLRRAPSEAQRETFALSAILLAAYASPSSSEGPVRLDAQSWVRLLDDNAMLTPDALERHYTADRARLADLMTKMRAVTQQLDRMPAHSPFAVWTRSIRALADGRAAADFPAVRDLCTHLLCNRLGVRLEAEGTLRYLAARAFDDQEGELRAHIG
jgi:hypothetical protein